jgi:hypothetical protein
VKLIRSWPLNPPEDRNYVIDDAERLYNDNYDYRGLVDVDDDIIHIDWDTAVSREHLALFAEACRLEPDRTRVAPVPVYPDSRRGLPTMIWNLKRYEGNGMRYLRTGEPTCNLFGFGMVYLPHTLLRGYAEALPGEVLGDISFAGWHHRNVEPEVPVAWDVRPIHVHYRISDVVS